MSKRPAQKNGKKARVKAGRRIVPNTPKPMAGSRRLALDPAAAAYTRLIMDPCNAPLTNTIWPGAAGAFVSRFETDFIVGNTAGDTAVAGFWCPAANALFQTTGTSPLLDTSLVRFLSIGTNAPGRSFLRGATVGSFRIVAGCLQISFPGTELNRSGIVACGIAPLSAFTPNITTANGGDNQDTTVAAQRSFCQSTERMPTDMCEIIWFPGNGDQRVVGNFAGESQVDIQNENSGSNCVAWSASGYPAGTGVRLRMVAVYEWTPKASANTGGASNGFVATVETPKSTNSLNDILMALPAAGGTNWFINAWKKARPYVKAAGSAISYGAKVLGPALAVL